MAIWLLQTTRNFCISSHLLSEQILNIFNADVACITFSDSMMSKCLSLSQLTNTALIFLLRQQQSFSLGSNPCTTDSVSQQKTKFEAWASILAVIQLVLFFFSFFCFFFFSPHYENGLLSAIKSRLLPS